MQTPRVAKRTIRASLLLLAACFGGREVFLDRDVMVLSPTDYLFGLAYLCLGIAWCHYDAIDRHYMMGMNTKLWLVLIFGLGFPIYLFRSRGIAGVKALGRSLLFLCAVAAAVMSGALLSYGIACWLGLVAQD